MSTIEELLVNYKNVNDQLVKNNELNEKIFKEITFSKIKKSFQFLSFTDFLNIIFVPGSIILAGYCVYKCFDNVTMFIISLITFISISTSHFLYFKFLKYKFFILDLLYEQSVSKSILEIKDYMDGLKKSRLWGLLIFLPVFIFINPLIWYIKFGWTIEGVYIWNLEHGTLPQLILKISISIIFGVFLVWKTFDWLYFPKLERALKNLKELV